MLLVWIVSLLAVFGCGPGKQANAAPAPPLSQAERWLQGTWRGDWKEENDGAWVIRFDGQTYRAEEGKSWYRGSFTTSATEPASIDLTIDDCECGFKGKISRSIFRNADGVLHLAGAEPGDERPTRFATDTGGVMFLVRSTPTGE